MYRIYCDETWTANYVRVRRGYYVFYGVMVTEPQEAQLLAQIDAFKRQRGLWLAGKPVEIKWQKVEEEWKQAQRAGRASRYEAFLELFFQALRHKELTFGYMFVKKAEYERVEAQYLREHPGHRLNFFFMLYFQFLYHCFVRTQVKHHPCQIFIDNRDMGAAGQVYNLGRLKQSLNQRLHKDAVPREQLVLSPELRKQFAESIQFVNLAESKQAPLIQLSDLCAGCVRFVLENELAPPSTPAQLDLFATRPHPAEGPASAGKARLAHLFYERLRSIDRYGEVDLGRASRHHRFSIFPFEFSKKPAAPGS